MFSFTLPVNWHKQPNRNGGNSCSHARSLHRHKALRVEPLELRLSLSGDAMAAQFAAAAVQPLPVNNLALATPLPQAAVAAFLPQSPAGDSLAAVMVMNQVMQADAVQQLQSGFNPVGQFPFDPFAVAVTQDSFTDVEPRVIHISEEEALLVEPQVTPDDRERMDSPADTQMSLLASLFTNEQLPQQGSMLQNN